MTKTKTWIFAVVLMITRAAQAGEVCDTIDSCHAQKAKVEARLAILLKKTAPDLTDVLVWTTTQEKAEAYCNKHYLGLPTVRELALYSRSLGARRIRKTAKTDYYQIWGLDGVGNSDIFYYSSKGYRRPKGNLGDHSFWSSSFNIYADSAYVLYGNDGYIEAVSLNNDDSAVRCVRSR